MENCETCTICHNKIEIKKSVLTSCGHRFCSECFFKWMKRKTDCPNCRKEFSCIENVRQEFDELVETTQDWEEYRDQLRENIIQLEERLGAVHSTLTNYENRETVAKKNLNIILNKINNETNRFNKIEVEWNKRQRRRSEYIREWKELHKRKSNFKLRFL